MDKFRNNLGFFLLPHLVTLPRAERKRNDKKSYPKIIEATGIGVYPIIIIIGPVFEVA